MVSGAPKMVRAVASGIQAALMAVSAPIITHQPVEPSARAIVSITSMIWVGCSAWPLRASGSTSRKRPASASSGARSAGSRRAASISSERAARRGASRRASARTEGSRGWTAGEIGGVMHGCYVGPIREGQRGAVLSARRDPGAVEGEGEEVVHPGTGHRARLGLAGIQHRHVGLIAEGVIGLDEQPAVVLGGAVRARQ